MHQAVRDFIAKFEVEAHEKGHYRHKLGVAEVAFLENVLGPLLRYIFDGLRAEYPLKDFRDRERFADFIYTRGGIRLLIEIDGITTHARNLSSDEFEDHLARQNDLVLQGWMILRFSARQVEKQPMMCQRIIAQAIGHWWMTINRVSPARSDDEKWAYREQEMVQLALRNGGYVRVQDLPINFAISTRSARKWLARFTKSGLLEPIKSQSYTVRYRLAGYSNESNLGA